MPAEQVDGNDVVAVDAAARGMAARVRAGRGPELLHAITYRIKGHVSVDPAGYRDPNEVARALESDPIAIAAAKLLDAGVAHATLEAIRAEAEAEVARAVAAAEAAPWPSRELAYTEIQDVGAAWR